MKSIKNIAFVLLLVFALSHCTKNDDCDPDAFCDTLPYDSGNVNIGVSYKGNGIPIIVYFALILVWNIHFLYNRMKEEGVKSIEKGFLKFF